MQKKATVATVALLDCLTKEATIFFAVDFALRVKCIVKLNKVSILKAFSPYKI